MSIQGFQKDDIICDYHGKTFRFADNPRLKMDEYCKRDGVDETFCCEVKTGSNKRIIDASSEECVLHKGHRCLGRLSNHASNKSQECNMKLIDIPFRRADLPAAPESAAVFVATRKIEPFEELRWDYEDSSARNAFDQSNLHI